MDRTRRFRKLKERRQVTTSGGSPSLLGVRTGARALPGAAGGETSGPGQDRVFYSHQGGPSPAGPAPGTAAQSGDDPAGTRRAAPHTPGVPQATRRSAFIAGAQPAAANKTSPEHLYLDPSLIKACTSFCSTCPFHEPGDSGRQRPPGLQNRSISGSSQGKFMDIVP